MVVETVVEVVVVVGVVVVVVVNDCNLSKSKPITCLKLKTCDAKPILRLSLLASPEELSINVLRRACSSGVNAAFEPGSSEVIISINKMKISV